MLSISSSRYRIIIEKQTSEKVKHFGTNHDLKFCFTNFDDKNEGMVRHYITFGTPLQKIGLPNA